MEFTISGDQNAVVSASLGFLFEASADSDSLLDDPDSVSLGDDDAESCSWDSSDDCFCCEEDDVEDAMDDDFQEHSSNANADLAFGFNGCDEFEEADRSCDDDDDRRVIGPSRIGGGKSSASVESTAKEFEALSEVEKNRLFWEACLAS